MPASQNGTRRAYTYIHDSQCAPRVRPHTTYMKRYCSPVRGGIIATGLHSRPCQFFWATGVGRTLNVLFSSEDQHDGMGYVGMRLVIALVRRINGLAGTPRHKRQSGFSTILVWLALFLPAIRGAGTQNAACERDKKRFGLRGVRSGACRFHSGHVVISCLSYAAEDRLWANSGSWLLAAHLSYNQSINSYNQSVISHNKRETAVCIFFPRRTPAQCFALGGFKVD